MELTSTKDVMLEILNIESFSNMCTELMRLLYFNKEVPENRNWTIVYPKNQNAGVDKYGVEGQADTRQQVTKAAFAFIVGSGFAARKNGWNELHDSTMKRKVRFSLDESFRVHRSSLRFFAARVESNAPLIEPLTLYQAPCLLTRSLC